MHINALPTEMLENVFEHLNTESLFNASLTSERWHALIRHKLPPLCHLHVEMDSLACDGKIIYNNNNTGSTTVCQCKEHENEQNALLKVFFRLIDQRLHTVIVEDNLLYMSKNLESIHDDSIHVILRECVQSSLKTLEFHSVDFSRVRVWTMAEIARFSHLTSLQFIGCKFPSEVNESLLIRMLSSSLKTLEKLAITDNNLVSEKLCHSLAKKCPNLCELNVSGCKKITAVAVLGFCETLFDDPNANPLNLNFRNTSFNPIQLSRHLNNPLLRCGPCWKAMEISVEIGFNRNAILLQNSQRNDLVILIFI